MQGTPRPTSSPPKSASKGRDQASRTHDPERTKQDILAVATKEFAREGLSGARIDEIAERTKTSKRMIYYYFGSKEGLYQAVLETEYRRIRTLESTLELDCLPPLEALRKLVEFTFDFTHQNEAFVRLVMIENIHQGEYLGNVEVIQKLSAPMIDNIGRFYHRGVSQGVFRGGIEPLELHWLISAPCFFSVSNRSTFSIIFNLNLSDPKVYSRRCQNVLDMIERYVVCAKGSSPSR